jgi:hypothetical protein
MREDSPAAPMTLHAARLPLLLGLLASLALAALAPAANAGSQAFTTSVGDTERFADPTISSLAFQRVRGTGARAAQLTLQWADVAPTRPVDPANPADRAYNWRGFDEQVQRAVAAGLTPTADVLVAPTWASGGDGFTRPDPRQFGLFAQAAATRYSGRYAGLPRVGSLQAWNEPNASFFLRPQYSGDRAVSPGIYRDMLSEFSKGVARAGAGQLVVAGNTFPFSFRRGDEAVAPLAFMREILCLTPSLRAGSNCGPAMRFDVWGHHPYTSGGPNHVPFKADDVSLGNLGKMRKLLDAAQKAGRIKTSSGGRVRFWVTEFTWDSNPPDPKGVKVSELKRWVPEAMFNSYKAGVDQFTWFSLRDQSRSEGMFQSGLYYRCEQGFGCDTPKPFLDGFRFPFVAQKNPVKRGRTPTATVWGRTPASTRSTLSVDQLVNRKWTKIGSVKSDGHGVLESSKIRLTSTGALRARLSSASISPSFSLARTKDHPAIPFGS